MLRKRVWYGAALAVAVAGICAGVVVWRASRAVRESAESVASEGRIRFTSRVLDRTVPAGFESISAPAGFRDVAVYHGRIFIAGAGGLYEYDRDGGLVAQYRAGLELPPSPVVALAVSEPDLWMATASEGALAFDGREFRRVRAEAAEYRKLTSVLPLSTGRVLFGTEHKGVLVYDGKSLGPLHPSLSDLNVTRLAGDEANLWIGTIDRGAFYFHAGQLDRFGEAEGVPDPHVLALAADGSNAFVGTALGVAEIQDARFRRVIAQGYTSQALLPQTGGLLVGTLGEGLVEVPRGRRNECEDCTVERLIRAGDQVLALSGDELYALGHGPMLKRESAALADRNIAAVAADATGRLWIGYFDRGLEILEADGRHGKHVEDQHVFCVNRVVHDRERGRTAVATANGLVLFDAAGTVRQVLGRTEGMIANQVTDVLIREDGAMVAATPAGVSLIDRGGVSSLYAFHGLVNNHVYSLARMGGRTLIGTLGGLSVLEAGAITASYTTANSGLKHNWITALVDAGGGELFAGTYGAGVMAVNARGEWRGFADLPREFEVNTNAMVATQRALYAGTLGRGLAVYNRAVGRWTWVTEGLPSLNVTALDAAGGWLYIGTDNGLVRVPEERVSK